MSTRQKLYICVFLIILFTTNLSFATYSSDLQTFFIINEDEFGGHCTYYPEDNDVGLLFVNEGGNAYKLKELIGCAVTKDNKIYILELTKFLKDGQLQVAYVINPGDRITVFYNTPESLRQENLRGFNIRISNNKRIRFGYEKLSTAQKIWRPIYDKLPEGWKEELNKLHNQ